MLKRDFFIQAVKAGKLTEKAWLQSAFTVMLPTESKKPEPWNIYWHLPNGSTDPEQLQCVFLDGNADIVDIDDWSFDITAMTPPYNVMAGIDVDQDEQFPLSSKTVRISYGALVCNWLLVYWPFKRKLNFIEGRFNVTDIERLVEPRLVSDDEVTDPEKQITVSEYFKFKEAAALVEGLSEYVGVPTGTKKTMTRAKDYVKKRSEVLAKYLDKLSDPAVAAKANKELRELEDEWFKDDDALRFFIKSKSRNIIRAKMFNAYGWTNAFEEGSTGTYIEAALLDGWDLDNFDKYVNDSRIGAFKRGAETQLGGEATKVVLAIMEGVTVTEDDCGDSVGHPLYFNPKTPELYIDTYVLVNGNPILLTVDNIANYLDKVNYVRTPAHCKTAVPNLCKVCVGTKYSNYPNSIPSTAANITSIFMAMSMAATHGVELKTVPWEVNKTLS